MRNVEMFESPAEQRDRTRGVSETSTRAPRVIRLKGVSR
jgi:hypothetical protein